MPRYAALLRAVNVGGTGKLPMTDLARLCEAAGFSGARTLLASGNAVFGSALSEREVKRALEAQLRAYAGHPVGVLVRDAAQLAAVLADNPFAAAPGDRCVAIFLDAAPPADLPDTLRFHAGEHVAAGAREIYVHYPAGQARSRLVIPAARAGTARNMNTIAKVSAMMAV